jgi:hypothetical protein
MEEEIDLVNGRRNRLKSGACAGFGGSSEGNDEWKLRGLAVMEDQFLKWLLDKRFLNLSFKMTI